MSPGTDDGFIFTNKDYFSTYSHLMLGLFKTSRSSIERGWLSIRSQESMKTLPQHKSSRM